MKKGDSYAFCFTINNWTEEDWAQLHALACNEPESVIYMVFSMEHCGEPPAGVTWTPHIQAYVYFKCQHSLKAVSKMLSRASIRSCKGSPEHNFDYIKKEGEYYEFGRRPSQGKASADKLQLVMDQPYENFHLWNQYNKGYKELKASETFKQERVRPNVLMVDYLWRVIDQLPEDVYIWNMGTCDLFDGYQGEDTIVMNMPTMCISGPQLLLLEQWIIYNRPPRYRCGYVWSRVTATKIVIACEDKYKNLQEIKSYLSIDKDGEEDL